MAKINDNDEYDDDLTTVEVELVAKFTYLDHHKNESNREVDVDYFEITEDEDDEQDIIFTGHCNKAGDERSFWLSRVVGNVVIKGVNGETQATKQEFDEFLRALRKNKNTVSKQAATGCLVVSIALIGAMVSIPIGMAKIFI